MAIETLFGGVKYFTTLYACDLSIELDAEHGISSGVLPQPWRLWVEIDGVEYTPGTGSGAGVLTEQPRARGYAIRLPAGPHSWAGKWYGDSRLKLVSAVAKFDGRYAYGGATS